MKWGSIMTREKTSMFRRRSLRRTAAAVSAVLLAAPPAQLPLGHSIRADAAGVFAELYVSPDGDDSNAGTLESPLRTLAGARDAVRKIKNGMTGNIRHV